MSFWQKELETMSLDQIHEVQLGKMQSQAERIYNNNKFYRKRFAGAGLQPGDIKSLNDIKKMPFTYKKDLRENYPGGLISGNWEKVVRVHMTSGTTGVPVPMVYTRDDLEVWTTCMARNFTAGGIKKSDIVQQAHGLGLFTGGMGFHYGLERVGAKIIPTGAGGTEKQLRLMKEWGTTVFTGTPSYAVYLGEIAADMGIDPAEDLKLRLGFHGGEPCTDEMRQRINKKLGYSAHGGGMRRCYGLTEMGGPISMDCEFCTGIHIWADHYLVEVIDPDTGEPAGPGEPGELVVSNLSFEAMPILRYRTGDRVVVDYSPCICGRTHPRITGFLGRVDDMLLVSGTNVFPSQIEAILLQHMEISENWQIVLGDKKGLHTLRVDVEPVTGLEIDGGYIERLEERLHESLEITCKVQVVPVGSLKRFEGKAARVVDERRQIL